MTEPKQNVRVNVDPSNPGQFLACCGLLELADRLWPGAEGWFTGTEFCITGSGPIETILALLVMDPPEEVTRLPSGLEVKRLIAPLRLSFDGGATERMTLDGWMAVKVDKDEVVAVANPPWNFWSGQQTSLRIWGALRAALAEQLMKTELADISDLFNQRVLLSGRFGFDPGPAWNALDAGFSPNEQKLEVASSAAVELLAAIGLQRFRPLAAADRASFEYVTWGQPLAPAVAAAAAVGVFSVPSALRYRCRVVSRGSYAALAYSTSS